jgi:hypothetical protein
MLLWRVHYCGVLGLLRPFADARLPRTTAAEKGAEKERKIPEKPLQPNKKTGVKRQWRKAEYVRYRPGKA